MIILLRGHIRTGFDTPQMYNFLQLLHTISPLTIYIHTWGIQQNSLSWRPIKENKTEISKDTITAYFCELAPCIKTIRIDPDGCLPLIGNTEGCVVRSSIPTRGWKNMWAGKYTMLEQIYQENSPSLPIINTRFDLFTNSNNFSSEELLSFFKNSILTPPKAISFLRTELFNGCDNFYIGSVYAMFKLAEHFHMRLASITTMNNTIYNPERLVMIEAQRLEEELKVPA
jgi:hypothetical protein